MQVWKRYAWILICALAAAGISCTGRSYTVATTADLHPCPDGSAATPVNIYLIQGKKKIIVDPKKQEISNDGEVCWVLIGDKPGQVLHIEPKSGQKKHFPQRDKKIDRTQSGKPHKYGKSEDFDLAGSSTGSNKWKYKLKLKEAETVVMDLDPSIIIKTTVATGGGGGVTEPVDEKP